MTPVQPPVDDEMRIFSAVIPPMLSFVSGFVDTIGFLGLFGLLTSQVTGSFIAAGTGLVHPEPGLTAKLLAIPMFMVGAGIMTLAVAFFRRTKRHPIPYALALVSILIALFLAVAVAKGPLPSGDSPAALTAAILAFVAMGAESALVRVLFKGTAPANFMTGNVTQVAVELTDLLLESTGLLHEGDAAADHARISAAIKSLRTLLPMILCFVLGAVIAAHAFIAVGFYALLLASGLVMAAALWASHGGT